MKHYDPNHPDANGVGTPTEPPATAHSGSTDIFPTCFSKLYIEYFVDVYMEVINAIIGANITLDGTDRQQLKKAIKKLSGSTGDVKYSYVTTAPDGWIFNTGSIGSASSGATQRANADTFDLYSLMWTNVANTEAPVSGGRGASALADFNANKTLTLPDGRGRTAVAKDNLKLVQAGTQPSAGTMVEVDGTVLGKVGGDDTHTLIQAQLPVVDLTHDHDFTAVITSTANASQTGADDVEATLPTLSTTDTASIGFGSGNAHNNTQPSLVLNMFIKL